MLHVEQGVARDAADCGSRAQGNPPVRSILVSLVMPGVKASVLGKALAEAVPGAEFHDALRFKFESSDTPEGVDTLNSMITFRCAQGMNILHGKEVLEVAQTVSKCPKITMLGNPVLRAADSYRNVCRDTAHPLHAGLKSSGMTMAEFYRSPLSLLLRNRQCRKLACMEESEKIAPDRIYEIASEKIRTQFHWIALEGITGGPQKELAQLLREFDFECTVPMIHSERGPKELPDPETRQAILEANSADWRLWQDALRDRPRTFPLPSWLRKFFP